MNDGYRDAPKCNDFTYFGCSETCSTHTKNLSVMKLRFNKHIVIRCSTVQYCYPRVSLKYISYCIYGKILFDLTVHVLQMLREFLLDYLVWNINN